MKNLKAFEAHPPETRQKVLDLFDAGTAPKDIAKETGVNITTVYAWRRKFGDPQPVAPPQVKNDAKTPGAPKVKANAAKGSISEAACAEILSSVFNFGALLFGPFVALRDDELKMRSREMSNCSNFIPKPIGNAITKYTSPMVFVAGIGSTLMARWVTYQQLCAQADAQEAQSPGTGSGTHPPFVAARPEPHLAPQANLDPGAFANVNGRLRDAHAPPSPDVMPPGFG